MNVAPIEIRQEHIGTKLTLDEWLLKGLQSRFDTSMHDTLEKAHHLFTAGPQPCLTPSYCVRR